jgi:Family of unknown function (DUF6588)
MNCDPQRARVRDVALVALTLLVSVAPARAQIQENLSSYGAENAVGYLEPLKDAFAAGLSNGLFPAGGVPTDRLHFRLSLQAMVVNFGDDDRTFTARTPQGFPVSEEIETPTVVGDTQGPSFTDSGSGATFSFPGGLDIDRLPLAVPQLTLGGILNSEVTLRFLGFDTGDQDIGNINFIGFGGRHNLSTYLPMFPLDLAAMVYYQKLEVGDDLLNAKVFSIGLQASKKFTMLEPYVGLGLDRSSLDVNYEDQSGNSISVEFEEESNAHLTLGAVLHLAILHINGEFSRSDRSSYTLGASVGF